MHVLWTSHRSGWQDIFWPKSVPEASLLIAFSSEKVKDDSGNIDARKRQRMVIRLSLQVPDSRFKIVPRVIA